jgi:hypothetical protein
VQQGAAISIEVHMTLLQTISTRDLLIELMYGGSCGILPELSPREPFLIESLVAELESRSGKSFGVDLRAWVDWYVLEDSHSDSDRNTLTEMYRFKTSSDDLSKRT